MMLHLLQQRYRPDLFLVKKDTIDRIRTGQTRTGVDGFLWRDAEIDRNVVRLQVDFVVNDLQCMYCSNNRCIPFDYPGFERDGEFQVGIATAFPYAPPLTTHPYPSAQDHV